MTDPSRDIYELADSLMKTEDERALRCSQCGHAITSDKERLTVQGGHRHTFVNPGGYVYIIGCFRGAPGCVGFGEASSKHTWFPGRMWRLALCGSCWSHIGWSFESPEESFFGLIVDRLSAD